MLRENLFSGLLFFQKFIIRLNGLMMVCLTIVKSVVRTQANIYDKAFFS